jgi:hypothetical protein
MSDGRNANDGTGRGIVFLHTMTTVTAIADTRTITASAGNLGYASGMYCSEDGTIEVWCLTQGAYVIVPIAAFKDNIWNIIGIGTQGSVDLANVTLFWQ